MRTHRQIVQSYGAAAMARALSRRGLEVREGTPRAWAKRDSIPAEYWLAVVSLNATTLEELALGAQGAGSEPIGMAEEGRRFVEAASPDVKPTQAQRQAALEAFLALAGDGWRSDAAYGPRDELYER